MGIMDSIFDNSYFSSKDTKLKYTPMKFGAKKEMAKSGNINNQKEKSHIIRSCVDWVYYRSVDWCVALKNTDIHKRCMLELLNNMEDNKGVTCVDYPTTILLEGNNWVDDYWYNQKNHKYYTKQQLMRIGKEFDKGRNSLELCEEMIYFVWYNMIDEKYLDEEIDDNIIYKIRVKFMK